MFNSLIYNAETTAAAGPPFDDATKKRYRPGSVCHTGHATQHLSGGLSFDHSGSHADGRAEHGKWMGVAIARSTQNSNENQCLKHWSILFKSQGSWLARRTPRRARRANRSIR